MKKIVVGAVLGAALVLSGCAADKPKSPYTDQRVDVVSELEAARKPLFGKLVDPLDKDLPIIAASFANIDDLTSSSTFGRMVSEVISAGLTNRGYQVIEVKMRDSLFIKQGAGEFMLSRKIKNLSNEYDAQAVLLGTYAIGGTNLYVNARLVRTSDNIILGSHDFVLPLNKDIKHLLGVSLRR